MKGDRLEIVVDAREDTRTYEVSATRAGRRVEVSTGRGIVEVTEVTSTGTTVRTARFMASRVIALVEHPVDTSGRLAGACLSQYHARMELLEPVTQPYAWGSHTAIAALAGRPVPTAQPEAELWMGAHPSAPSGVALPGGGHTTLDAVIAADPVGELGPASVSRFGGRLPFLLKVLAAETALSIQVHPSRGRPRPGSWPRTSAASPRPTSPVTTSTTGPSPRFCAR